VPTSASVAPVALAKAAGAVKDSHAISANKISQGKAPNGSPWSGNHWSPQDNDIEGVGEWDGEEYDDKTDWNEPGKKDRNGWKSNKGKGKPPYISDPNLSDDVCKWCNSDLNPRHFDAPDDTLTDIVDIDLGLNLDRAAIQTPAPAQHLGSFEWPKKNDDRNRKSNKKGKEGKGKKKCPKYCHKPMTTKAPAATSRSAQATTKVKKTKTKTVTKTRTSHFPFTYTHTPSTKGPTTTRDTAVTTLITTVVPPPFPGPPLAGVCPVPCDPFYPSNNKCDPNSTSCTTTGGKNYYCACRAGYRLNGFNSKDFQKQIKIPGQPYVYVEAGLACNIQCDDQTCTDVLERPQCK